MSPPLPIDVVIFGGGAAGLWLLDELTRFDRRALLLEANELGSGQTIASQGIIHGGLKYTLSGLFTPSARAVSEMPLIWRRCLAGEAKPDLSDVRLRAEYCHLWRTQSIRSRLAMIGARAGLRIAPVPLAASERPAALADCPGVVARLDEQVIEPASFIAELSNQHAAKIIKIDAANGLEFDCDDAARVKLVRLLNPETGEPADLAPSDVVLTAGAGNAELRKMLGLSPQVMQRRPLHMVMVRGDLPTLNAHCVDGMATRLTITTTRDFDDRVVWQVGGQVAEKGVEMSPAELIAHAASELRAALPAVDLSRTQWATYTVDRAEGATRSGSRPDEPTMTHEGNVITAWPTKLALVPEMVRQAMEFQNTKDGALQAANPDRNRAAVSPRFFEHYPNWPRPVVALPPWETQEHWTSDA